MESYEKNLIETVGEAITISRLNKLKEATFSKHLDAARYIYPTIYRHNEFSWLNRLGIGLKNILHIEQEFQYILPQPEDEIPVIKTKLLNFKERSNFNIIMLETEIITNGTINTISRTTFWAKKGNKNVE